MIRRPPRSTQGVSSAASDVYKRQAGLLSEKTILAHCIYLTEEEKKLLLEKKCGLVHCPSSNFNLMSGVFDSISMKKSGFKIGLGTDLCGGYSPSMLNAIRSAIQASVVHKVANPDPNCRKLSLSQAFYLATLGSAEVLGLQHLIGNFESNKEFDALVISMKDSDIDIFGFENFEQLFEKFILLGDDRNIKSVYVQGKSIK
eukprot:TRINITY_DN3979_c0_g1_i3.p1 TRINITY_DN3979_c0_g1~~TRINITY_DN3979_c0_g1_i3.p1  ORF type:complete len:201 (-),score=41.30 TRINITY_DN3979_c0_g1_i3:180-782(-)